MSILFNDITTQSTDAVSISFSHRCTDASNSILLVGVHFDNDNESISSVQWGGQSLTQVPGAFRASPGGIGDNTTGLWYLISPIPGTETLTVTLTDDESMTVTAMHISGVKQLTPFSDITTDRGDETNGEISLTTESGEVACVFASYRQGSSFSIDTGTTIYGAGNVPSCIAVQDDTVGTINFNITADDQWSAIGLILVLGSENFETLDELTITESVEFDAFDNSGRFSAEEDISIEEDLSLVVTPVYTVMTEEILVEEEHSVIVNPFVVFKVEDIFLSEELSLFVGVGPVLFDEVGLSENVSIYAEIPGILVYDTIDVTEQIPEPFISAGTIFVTDTIAVLEPDVELERFIFTFMRRGERPVGSSTSLGQSGYGGSI